MQHYMFVLSCTLYKRTRTKSAIPNFAGRSSVFSAKRKRQGNHDKQSSSDLAITMEALGGHAASIQPQPSTHNTNNTTTSRNSKTTNNITTTTRMYQTSNEGSMNLYKLRGCAGYCFCDLVEAVSNISPILIVRFTSSHPKDYPPELLYLMAERPNVCKQLHMPAKSRMRRGYTREAYQRLIDDVSSNVPM